MKKKLIGFIISLLSGFLIIGSQLFVYAEEVYSYNEYQSNGEITFYGKYEHPGPEKPNGSIPNSVKEPPEIIDHFNQTDILPRTGEMINNLSDIGGYILIVCGSILLYFKKRKEE